MEAEDFSLSEGRNSFGALPMYSAPQDISGTTQPVLLAPLGFEGSRLGQMLEQDDGATFSEMIGLIGAPALKPGWENRSIYSHLRYFSNVNTRLEYYSCRNPYQTLELLESIRFEADKLILAALGTKPSSLACAIFLINNFRKNTRLKMISAIYDFPVASYKRTVGVGKANLYRLNILSS